MAKKCSPTLAQQLHSTRQAAYDASRFSGKAGSHGLTADFHAREAERALKSGHCTLAEKHLQDARKALKKAWRAPTRRR